MKTIRYVLEAVLLYSLFYTFKIMPLDFASATGGWLGQKIGPKLAASRKALRNLDLAMPDMPAEKKADVIAGMWENLGRVMAEYPHLPAIAQKRTRIKNEHILSAYLGKDTPCILVSAHIGNWEVPIPTAWITLQKEIHITYRAPNNPWSDKLLNKARTLDGQISAYPKAPSAAYQIVRALKKGATVGILIDQKFNEGIEAAFFGRSAMTNPAFVALGQKMNCPVIPVRCRRLNGADFEIKAYEPLKLKDETTGKNIPVEHVIKEAHSLLEEWITDTPEQWLWLHRRWKD